MNTQVLSPLQARRANINPQSVGNGMSIIAGVFKLSGNKQGILTYAWVTEPKAVMGSLGLRTSSFFAELEILRDMVDDQVRPFICSPLNQSTLETVSDVVIQALDAWTMRSPTNKYFVDQILKTANLQSDRGIYNGNYFKDRP